MKIYRNSVQDISSCVLALGSFDTLHIGHQQLLHRAREHAMCYAIPFGVYMFETRPALVFSEDAQKDVYNSALREEILRDLRVDFVYYEKFNNDFMCKSPEEFVWYLKEHLHVNTVVVGFNYRFGKNAEGDSELLMRLCRNIGIEAIVVPPVCDEVGVVSSTRIRGLLSEGTISDVNRLLGRVYSIGGRVQKDRGIGRKMGIPTANLSAPEDILLPKDGVYMTVANFMGESYPAVTNIGVRPTFDLNKRTIETHVLGYDGDLYGLDLRLAFHQRLRDEVKFEDEEALKKQILTDKSRAERIFFEINAEN